VSSPLTPQQCDDIETRANAATPGPWTVELEQCDCSDGLCGHGTYVSAVYANGERRTDFTDFPDADWQFTIHARTDVDALLATVRHLTKRVAELERPTVEAKRNEIRESYAGLAAQCREDRDYEGAFDVECRLRKREEQWAAEDAAAAPASV
jgi:hypothetical protein